MTVTRVPQVKEGAEDRTVVEEMKAVQFSRRKDGSQALRMRNSWLARVTGNDTSRSRASD